MYFNNVSIVYYLIIGLFGLMLGKFVAFCNVKFGAEEKITLKDFVKEFKCIYDKQYITMFALAIIYIMLLYKYGIKKDFFQNLDLIKFLILSPMLLSAFMVDLKHRIIPNRLNMLIFEVGIILVFVYGIDKVAVARDMVLGLVVGAGIFLGITLLGGLIAGKEAMGFGDVKFMGALGLYYGASLITEITLLAFVGAFIFCIGLIIFRLIKKNDDEYLPFGPFLAAAAFAMMFLDRGTIFIMFMTFCKNLSEMIFSRK